MLSSLFRGLTAQPERGAALFKRVTAEARLPHWYVEAKVPDTLDGRFAVLATVTALVLVQLESLGSEGERVSVALAERFIAVMESEHRELGLGDPTLGRTVRKLVGKLAGRTALWRSAVDGAVTWERATSDSLYKGKPEVEALRHSAGQLQRLRDRLARTCITELEQGQIA